MEFVPPPPPPDDDDDVPPFYPPPPPPDDDDDDDEDMPVEVDLANTTTVAGQQLGVMSQPLPSMPPEYSSMSASQAAESGQGLSIPVRPKLSPFLPMHAAQEPVLVARSWTGRQLAADQRKLSRERKIAQDLPEWNPMPPGEMSVIRPTKAAKA